MKKFLATFTVISFLMAGLCFAGATSTKTSTTTTSTTKSETTATVSPFMQNLKKTIVGKTWFSTAHSNVMVKDEKTNQEKHHSVHGLKAQMICEDKGETVSCKVYYGETMGGDYELWVFSDTKLDQSEYSGEKAGDSYGATATDTKSDTARNYYINCKDKERTQCDVGISGKQYWNISVNPTTKEFKYIVRGLVKETDTTVGTRHIFSFSTTKAAA